MATALIIAVSWWFLFHPNPRPANDPPRAAGPYASQTLCLAAGHAMMPTERLFMTPEQLAQDDARIEADRKAAERRQAEEQKKAAANGKRPWSGTEFVFEWTSSGPDYRLFSVTGCMKGDE